MAGARPPRARAGLLVGGARCGPAPILALTFIAERTALRESDPMWIAAGRTAIGALALAPFLRADPRASWRAVLAIGLTSVAGFVGFQLVGLDADGIVRAVAIVWTEPGAGGDRRAPAAGRAADARTRGGRRADRAGRA